MSKQIIAILQIVTAAAAGLGLTLAIAAANSKGTSGPYTVVDLRDDPPIGTRLTLPIEDFLSGRWLVVYLGDCSSCSLSAVDPSKLPITSFDGVILIHEAAAPAKSLPKLSSPKVKLISRDFVNGNALLNTLWPGRWYVFQDGALIRIQKEANDRSWNDRER